MFIASGVPVCCSSHFYWDGLDIEIVAIRDASLINCPGSFVLMKYHPQWNRGTLLRHVLQEQTHPAGTDWAVAVVFVFPDTTDT